MKIFQIVLGALAALALFLFVRSRGAAAAAAPAPTPATYILPPSPVQAATPLTTGIASAGAAVAGVPYVSTAPPPPPELWVVHDAVQSHSELAGGQLTPFDAPVTTRGAAAAAGFGR